LVPKDIMVAEHKNASRRTHNWRGSHLGEPRQERTLGKKKKKRGHPAETLCPLGYLATFWSFRRCLARKGPHPKNGRSRVGEKTQEE